jgi:hypothetical protein
MADLTITAANVAAGSGAKIAYGTAGAALTAGQSLYLDSADGRYKLCDNDSATVAARSFAGIALHAAATGQPIAVLTDGPITIGATVAVGTIYCTSSTAGGIAPSADNGTGDYVTIIGIATSTSVVKVQPLAAGAVVA